MRKKLMMSNVKSMNRQPNFSKTKSDHTLSALKAVASAIPYIGGPLGSLLSDYLPDSVEKRKTEFLTKLAEELDVVQDRLQGDFISKDYFISTFMQSFRRAIENHQEEKIGAFRAIIVNAAIDQNPREDEIAIFISITDRLTPLHLKLLKILFDPQRVVDSDEPARLRFESISMGGLSTLFEMLLANYPVDLVSIAFHDLYNMGLQNTERSGVTMTRSGIVAKRTTEFGDRYLNYISLPNDVDRQLQ